MICIYAKCTHLYVIIDIHSNCMKFHIYMCEFSYMHFLREQNANDEINQYLLCLKIFPTSMCDVYSYSSIYQI